MMMCMTARNSSITPLDKANQGVAINEGGKAQGYDESRLSIKLPGYRNSENESRITFYACDIPQNYTFSEP